MTAGLFDLPAPLLDWTNERLAAVAPAPAAIAFWGIVGALLCIELYRLASPQRRIARAKQEARLAQRRLAAFDGDLDAAWPLMRNLLGASLRRVGLVLPGTLVAAYPVVALLVWLGNGYGYRYPAPGEPVAVAVAAPWQASWKDAAGSAPRVEARTPDGRLALEQEIAAAVPVVHKRAWWNALIANPAGYLPTDAPIDEIRIALPRRELIGAGPGWLRGWEPLFLAVLGIAALAYKRLRRIE